MEKTSSATRMVLLRLRRRLDLARRGHRLLKGKQDELLRRFIERLEEYLRRRDDLHRQTALLAEGSRAVRREVSAATLRTAAWPPGEEAGIDVKSAFILNLRVPAFTLRRREERPRYSPTDLPAAYDELALTWQRALPVMVDVGEKEKALLLLAAEIERTRRRVNALEYKLIPGLESRIKEIAFKMASAEMESIARLMRVKDVVRGRAPS